jgi:hypothetical protein
MAWTGKIFASSEGLQPVHLLGGVHDDPLAGDPGHRPEERPVVGGEGRAVAAVEVNLAQPQAGLLPQHPVHVLPKGALEDGRPPQVQGSCGRVTGHLASPTLTTCECALRSRSRRVDPL